GPWTAHHNACIEGRHAVVYGDAYLPLPAEQIRDWWLTPGVVFLHRRGEDYGIRFLGSAGPRLDVEIDEPWHEINTPEGVAELESFLLSQGVVQASRPA